MKITGTTVSGEFIVQMSRDEVEELTRLSKAIEGSSSIDLMHANIDRSRITPDLSTTFGNIRIWYMSKFNLNEMKQIFEEIENQLRGKDGNQKEI